jgi:hypothetical protein
MPRKYSDIIEKHAKRVGLDPEVMHRIMQVESSGNPNEVTGSYKGLFQLSEKEFRKHGGSGSIFDPDANAAAAANKLAQETLTFKQKYGRDPKPIDIYMTHQQGEGGYQAHMSNPDAPAWKNMYFTAEGQQKGQAWAKEAIWGNTPKSVKQRVGSVENLTSRDFVQAWDDSIKGGGATFGEGTEVASKASETKTAFLEGKDTPERIGTILGGFDEMPKWSGLQVPDIGPPRFKVGI